MNCSQSTAPGRRRGFRPIEPADGLQLFLSAMATPHNYLMIGLDVMNPAIVDELVPERLRAGELLVVYTAAGADATVVRTSIAEVTRHCPVPVRLVEVARNPEGRLRSRRHCPTSARCGTEQAEAYIHRTGHRFGAPAHPSSGPMSSSAETPSGQPGLLAGQRQTGSPGRESRNSMRTRPRRGMVVKNHTGGTSLSY